MSICLCSKGGFCLRKRSKTQGLFVLSQRYVVTTHRNVRAFKGRFAFDPAKSLYTGVERECFVTRNNVIVPEAHRVLEKLGHFKFNGSGESFGPELSACQVESRIGPCTIETLPTLLVESRNALGQAVYQLSLEECYIEVAPETMPLDVYKDRAGRYESIRRLMSVERLLAACRIIGTHVHIGMPDHQTALRVYNNVIRYCADLITLGDGSDGRRMEIYEAVTGGPPTPKPFRTWAHFHQAALLNGFLEDPRRCWDLVRISVHGTIEFRMFGATRDLEKVATWARTCHSLCADAMA
jgi:gamma-glutamyl:cysteine ligase YbdK (ATP-grasp superfamily)